MEWAFKCTPHLNSWDPKSQNASYPGEKESIWWEEPNRWSHAESKQREQEAANCLGW